MKILYIHQYFRTPKQPGGTRSYWLAKEMLSRGHSVTFVTTDKFQSETVKRYWVDGLEVVSYSVKYNQSMNIVERLKSYFTFSFVSTKFALKNHRNYDVIFATSTPLSVGIPALFLNILKKKKYIFEVRDLWPEVPIQMGAITNPIIIRVLRSFEKLIYKRSEHVITLSPGMREGVLRYLPSRKVSMIPNMSKKDEFFPRDYEDELATAIGLKKDYLKIVHFGSLGEANGIDRVFDSIELLKDRKFQFLFLGAGAMEDRLKRRALDQQLENVIFHPREAMEMTSRIVNLCDISLVSFKDLPILYTNSPNKLFDSLSAGKPIIVNSAGWTKDLVEDNNLGFYFDPKDPYDLLQKLAKLEGNDQLLRVMGDNSRRLAETTYDKSILVKRFGDIFEKVIT